MTREWNFLVSLPVGSALLVGVAMDDFLERRAPSVRPVLTVLALLVTTAWCLRQLVVWARGGDAFLSGWASLAETAIAVACFGICLFALRAETRGRWRSALVAILLLLVWTDLKVYGTSRRFNGEPGDFDRMRAGDASLGGPDRMGMERSVYASMRLATGFRVVENENPTLAEIRHYHLASPQGSDPMLPSRYLQELDGAATFIADRIFRIDPANESLLQRLGVRYVITIRHSPYFRALADKPRFRLLGSQDSFAAVFEFLDALPAYRWTAGAVTCTRWTAERREFAVNSASGGDFVLIEQFYPGWRAFLDNRPLPIHPFSRAFQQVSVPAGAHRLRFEYRARGLRSGAVISAVSALLVFLAIHFLPLNCRRSHETSN
jgi:hypothetical protein